MSFDQLIGSLDATPTQKKKRRRKDSSGASVKETAIPLKPSSSTVPPPSPKVERNVWDFDRYSSASSFPPIDLSSTDIVLLCKAKNEKVLLPSFLDHYKMLGVDAVVMLDNDSKDGTRPCASLAKAV